MTPERTRAIVTREDLQELATDAANVDSVLARLIEARLLVTEKSDTGVSVEIVHESLIARWPMLSRWLDENKEDADFLARLRVMARQWRESGKPRGLLWREDALLEARRFHDRRRIALSSSEEEYLQAVFALGRALDRRRRFIILSITAASAVITIVTGTLEWKEHEASTRATTQEAQTRQYAERARREAALARDAARIASAREHGNDPTFALALLREVEVPDATNAFPWMAARATRDIVSAAVLPDHDGQVWTAELSPDGRHALTAAGNFAFLWDARGIGSPVVLRGHTETVWRAT